MAKAKRVHSTPRRTASKSPKPADADRHKATKAYGELEPYLCEVVRMGEIASMLFANPDEGLFVFAATHLEEMLLELRRRCYAMDFPRLSAGADR
jgi:hypothetical protein